MRAHRVDALPLLDEHQPVGVLDIDMTMMRQTPRFAARPRAMLGAQRDHALAMLGGEDDVAGDENDSGAPIDRPQPVHREQLDHPDSQSLPVDADAG